jgi:hypothetical protein
VDGYGLSRRGSLPVTPPHTYSDKVPIHSHDYTSCYGAHATSFRVDLPTEANLQLRKGAFVTTVSNRRHRTGDGDLSRLGCRLLAGSRPTYLLPFAPRGPAKVQVRLAILQHVLYLGFTETCYKDYQSARRGPPMGQQSLTDGQVGFETNRRRPTLWRGPKAHYWRRGLVVSPTLSHETDFIHPRMVAGWTSGTPCAEGGRCT